MRHRVLAASVVVTALVVLMSGTGCVSSRPRSATTTLPIRTDVPVPRVEAREVLPTVYRNARVGFEVPIPAGYVAIDASGAMVEPTGQDRLTLIRASNIPIPPETEGPPSITIAAYENPGARSTIEWAQRETRVSNFSPDFLTGPHRIARTAVGETLHYTVAGLTNIDYAVVALGTTIVVLSASYGDAGDRLQRDFAQVVAGLRFVR